MDIRLQMDRLEAQIPKLFGECERFKREAIDLKAQSEEHGASHQRRRRKSRLIFLGMVVLVSWSGDSLICKVLRASNRTNFERSEP